MFWKDLAFAEISSLAPHRGVAVFESALLFRLAPEDLVVVIGVERRIDVVHARVDQRRGLAGGYGNDFLPLACLCGGHGGLGKNEVNADITG